jgi:3-deoxy-manno-octulosonate cytidylyltransferase (CMP-KDO synthetase)
MIVHVMRRAQAAEIGAVVVATDSEAIAACVEKAGGRAVMTRADHVSGSDRIFEALGSADPTGRCGIVVNVQGDLPTLSPADIGAAIAPLADAAVDIATLAAEISRADERNNPNVVKVVGTPVPPIAREDGHPALMRLRALYFTRATAPAGEGPLYHHIGLYAFRRPALVRFVSLPPSPLEQREQLEQLRALEAGMRIDVTIVDSVPLGVDTPEDLERARALLKSGV